MVLPKHLFLVLSQVMDASRLTFLGYTAADFAKWQWDERWAAQTILAIWDGGMP